MFGPADRKRIAVDLVDALQRLTLLRARDCKVDGGGALGRIEADFRDFLARRVGVVDDKFVAVDFHGHLAANVVGSVFAVAPSGLHGPMVLNLLKVLIDHVARRLGREQRERGKRNQCPGEHRWPSAIREWIYFKAIFAAGSLASTFAPRIAVSAGL